MLFLSGCGFQPLAHGDESIPLLNVAGIPTSIAANPFEQLKTETAHTASVLFFGDIMLDRNVKKRIDERGTDYLLENLAKDPESPLQTADIITANLEGPFADKRRPTTKSIAFRFDPALIQFLKKYRLNVLSQANNHSFDMGRDGFAESLKNLKAADIGAYGSEYEVNKDSLFYKNINDLRFAFLGVNDTHTRVTISHLKPFIYEAKQNADMVIVFMHWGEEYKTLSNTHQRALARQILDAGADVIIGAHSHVVQEVEIYNRKPIFYSLGNFIFDQYFSKETQEELGVLLNFTGKKLTSFRLLPIESDQSQLSWMEGDKKDIFLQNLFANSRINGSTTTTDTVELK